MVGGAMAGVMGAPALGQGRRRPPNVILMFSDDQGTLDMGCYGAEDLHTPHMDALAKRGTRFNQFYVGASVCSPSRASLLTGRYPIRAGVPGNVGPDNGLPERPDVCCLRRAAAQGAITPTRRDESRRRRPRLVAIRQARPGGPR